ncbi:MAG: zinc dependent phospholipase C family protein [Blautia glucerasea]|nr:zinc dependent phospholipase C family protein [Blautia glucerasea]
MRKKSHILLARYLADQLTVDESLQSHRKAFCLGSILPDIRPSFVVKKHEYFSTFGEIQEKMLQLVEHGPLEGKERVYWRNFGEVLHYMADYFTFPHNRTYTGSLYEHSQYEKILKQRLKTCIKNGDAGAYVFRDVYFKNLEELTEFIQVSHTSYLRKKRNITEDIQYILMVCYQVIQGIVQLCTRRQENMAAFA